jgi:dienelactone hydrolase
VKYQLFTYPGTQHGFNNDTTPRYDKGAADLAWKRTMDAEPRRAPPPRCAAAAEGARMVVFSRA